MIRDAFVKRAEAGEPHFRELEPAGRMATLSRSAAACRVMVGENATALVMLT